MRLIGHVILGLVTSALYKLIFASEKKISTRALISTRSGYCTSGIKSSKEITKSLLFLLLNRLVDFFGLELLEL